MTWCTSWRAPLQVSINRHVITNVLAVVDGSFLDVVQCLVDVADGALLFVIRRVVALVLQVGTRITQVAERMQVGGVGAGRIGKALPNRKHTNERHGNAMND